MNDDGPYPRCRDCLFYQPTCWSGDGSRTPLRGECRFDAPSRYGFWPETHPSDGWCGRFLRHTDQGFRALALRSYPVEFEEVAGDDES